jgi:hypothetical protein
MASAAPKPANSTSDDYSKLVAKYKLVEEDNFELSMRLLQKKINISVLEQERFLLLSELSKYSTAGEAPQPDPLASFNRAASAKRQRHGATSRRASDMQAKLSSEQIAASMQEVQSKLSSGAWVRDSVGALRDAVGKKIPVCSACGLPGHLKTSRTKCPLYTGPKKKKKAKRR